MQQHLDPPPRPPQGDWAPVNLQDFEARAQSRLTPQAWAYLAGGAADEHSLAANRHDWDRLRLWPRVLQPLAGSQLHTRLAGQALAHPLLLAPVAYQRLAHPDGELASAAAAAAQGAGMILSMQSSVEVERVAGLLQREPGAGPLWFQLAWLADRGRTAALARRAEAAGCQALVLTVDAPLHGARDRERRAGFRLPPGVAAVHLAAETGSSDLATLLGRAPGWDDVAWLATQTCLPLWLKGVLHPDDARQALGLGVAGLIVSNHGGRTLDTAVSTAWALPRVAQAVAGQVPLVVDGGIRRGTDVLKALALGASAVAVGRPQVMALAANGALGVAQMLRLLQDELAIAMALCGCRTVADIGPPLLAT
jgi:4-hydroxymandelate oxidase